MCGISGFYQSSFNYLKDEVWEHRLIKMKEAIAHRGPNENDIYLSPHAGLAHTRLSIIDISGGHQPMMAYYNGHRATICYNGEIYNYPQLKAVLMSRGALFSTDSDTEVILMGYLMYGVSFFSSLNGIFAFSIYDETTDELIIARDHLGVKPLFYQPMATSFVFGSEPKALFAYGIIPYLNQESFKEVLALGPARTPGHGVYAGMKELLPGTYMIIKPSHKNNCYESETHFFFKLTAKEITDSYEEAVEKVSYLINDAIKRQMISDIPICTFMSGGLDSSLVSAICARNLDYDGKTLTTFSFDFTDNNKNFKSNDFQSTLDRPFVDIMKKHINSHHIYLECNNEIQADYLLKAVDARDLPCMADVESSLLYFCSLVSKEVRVALTGECADEIFGGYPWFHKPELMDKGNFPWSYDFDARSVFLKDEIKDLLKLEEYSANAYENTIAAAPVLTSDTLEERKSKQTTYLNVMWFMQTLLNRMDRTSMYSGLEARVPFADYRILEYVYNLPWEYKCHDGIHKSLLVETGKQLLPNEVLYRKKSPYPKTYDLSYEKLLAGRLRDILSDVNSPLHDLVDTNKVYKFLDSKKDYGKPWYGQLMAGPQMIGYFIQIDYWLRKCHYKL
ncbi:MAG: asparagine synthase (glutamine-hydrolyzing) [Lachnospiraceae bacterium]|nr:asparagine synthase (glutamine-hydrolyzing) [Lachnospiraceae bacterium]